MKLRIGGQLASLVAIPLVLLAALTVAATFFFLSVKSASDALVASDALSARLADISRQITAERLGNSAYDLDGKPDDVVASRAARDTASDDLDYAITNAKLVPGLAAHLATISSLLGEIDQRSTGILGAAAKNRQDVLDAYGGKHTPAADAVATMLRDERRDNKTLDAEIAAMIDLAAKKAAVDKTHIEGLIVTVRWTMIAIGVLAFVLTAVAGALFATRLRTRLRDVSRALRDIIATDLNGLDAVMTAVAEGDMTARYHSTSSTLIVRGSDEIADLTESYNALAEGLQSIAARTNDGITNLSQALARVSQTATHLALASMQVSSASSQAAVSVEHIAGSVDSVAHNASEQSGSISATGIAIEELARAAQQIAEGSKHQSQAIEAAVSAMRNLDAGISTFVEHGRTLAQSARAANAQTEGGSDAVGATAAAMRSLHERTRSAQTAMATLEERSLAVEEIVRTIEEIADQTNLLALNAAIEAARAGDHGRGFAVVADEVRKLAERSAIATREIGTILTSIRRETISAADALRTSAESMDGGLSLAQKAAEALASVGEAIAATNRVAGELSERTEAMRSASISLATNIDSASAIVGQNSAAASQMRLTTDNVARTIVPIMHTAEAQSSVARDVSAATTQLAAGVQEMDATARALSDQAEVLRGVVSTFRITVLQAPEPEQELIALGR